MIFPNNNLPNDAQPWGREIQKQVETLANTVASNDVNNTARDKQLAASVTRLDKTVTELAITKGLISGTTTDLTAINTQLNGLYAANTMSLQFSGADAARTDSPVAQLTFVKPAWATKATVTCTGTISAITSDQAGNPVSGTMVTVIDGVKCQLATSISDPTLSGSISTKTFNTTAANVTSTATQSFARSFNVSGNITVQLLVTKTANTLTTASFYSNLVANVFWSK